MRSKWGKAPFLIAVVPLSCLLSAPAAVSAAPVGSIAGTVTGADTHTGLEGAEVCASRLMESEEEGESEERCDATDSAGAYSIEALEEGGYEIWFWPRDLPYFAQYREEFIAVAGGPVVGVDAELNPAATIAGTVTAGGPPVEGDRVCAWRLPGAEKGLCAWTGEDGRYKIRFATPGNFRVEFQDVRGFSRQYFDHKRHAPEADTVAATLGAVHSGVDASLEAGGWVRGTVRASTGAPLQEILVCAVEAFGLGLEACDETGIFGQYAVGPLATGSYKIGFSVELGREFFGEELFLGENDGFQTRYYDEQTSLAAATTIGLLAPDSLTGIDARLFPTRPSTAVSPPVMLAPSPLPPASKPRRLHCRRGFKKKKVHGRWRCVKIHGKRRT